MRGSQPVSDQTAMNNKHIKRFHFSINPPPTSIRSGSRASQELIRFLQTTKIRLLLFPKAAQMVALSSLEFLLSYVPICKHVCKHAKDLIHFLPTTTIRS